MSAVVSSMSDSDPGDTGNQSHPHERMAGGGLRRVSEALSVFLQCAAGWERKQGVVEAGFGGLLSAGQS